MAHTTIPDRIDIIKEAIGVTEDIEFGKLAGMSKSVVNQLRTGKMKSIAARYAYRLEDKTGFFARWIQLGEGPRHFVYAKTEAQAQVLKVMEKMDDQDEHKLVSIGHTIAQPKEGTNGGQ